MDSKVFNNKIAFLKEKNPITLKIYTLYLILYFIFIIYFCAFLTFEQKRELPASLLEDTLIVYTEDKSDLNKRQIIDQGIIYQIKEIEPIPDTVNYYQILLNNPIKNIKNNKIEVLMPETTIFKEIIKSIKGGFKNAKIRF